MSCSSFSDHLNQIKSDAASDRIEGIYWLSMNMKSPTTQKLLIEAFRKDESEIVRSLAARLIVLENNPDYVPLLVLGLHDSSPLVRMEVVQGLGSLQAKTTLPDLSNLLLNDSDIFVRLKVLKSIQYMNATESIPSLIDALGDPEPAVRFYALLLLEQFTQEKPGIDKQSWKKWYEKKSTTSNPSQS